jgi:hypothetical protein
MTDCQGWISLHRKFLDWEWYTDINTCHLFTYCLLKANHIHKKWRGIDIGRGQFITSLDSLSKDTGLSVMKIRTAINKLESTNELTSKASNKSRLITVVNYDLYQGINKQDNKQVTSEQQTDNKQITTTNNENNNNNENNDNKISDFDEFWNFYGKIGNKQQAIKSFKKTLKLGVNYETIINGVRKYQNYCKAIGQEQRFIKHASTWLNNRGWDDDYTIYEQSAPKHESNHQRAKKALGLA